MAQMAHDSSPPILPQSVSWPLQHLMTSSLIHFINLNSTLCPFSSTPFQFHSASGPITYLHTFPIDAYYEPLSFHHTYSMEHSEHLLHLPNHIFPVQYIHTNLPSLWQISWYSLFHYKPLLYYTLIPFLSPCISSVSFHNTYTVTITYIPFCHSTSTHHTSTLLFYTPFATVDTASTFPYTYTFLVICWGNPWIELGLPLPLPSKTSTLHQG